MDITGETITEVVSIARNVTVIAVLLVAVVGAMRGWWVPGYLYVSVCLERDKQTALAEKAIEISQKLLAKRSRQ